MNVPVQTEPPVYDEKNETITQYLRRVDAYKMTLNSAKYNIVLDVFNDIFKLKDKQRKTSLTNLTYFPFYSKMESLHIKHILDKHKKNLLDHFDFKVDELEQFDKGTVLIVLSAIFQKIQYKIKVVDKKGHKYLLMKKA